MKITEAVAEKIAKSGEQVESIVIDKLAQAEINRRVDLITKGLQKLETLNKELKKVNRCDTKSYIDGKPVESMTEKRYQEIDKAKKSIERLESAISTAMEKNDEDSYKKLSDAIGGGANKPENKSEEKTEEKTEQ